MLADNVAHDAALQRPPLQEIFRNGKQQTMRRILLGMGTQFMQQIGGTNVVATYLPVVLTRSFHMSERLALILSATVSIWLMIWGAIAALFIDNIGRKKLMTWGAFFESICFAIIAAGLAVGTNTMLIVAVVFIYLYYTFYGLSFLSIPFMYPAEINSQRMRNIGTSFSTMMNWMLCYVVVSVTPTGIANLGWRYYLIYAITNMCFVPIVHFFYVETARLSLEDIDRVFEIKYDGGSKMSYKSATKLACSQRQTDEEKMRNEMEVKHVENLETLK
jgi:MFS family permease